MSEVLQQIQQAEVVAIIAVIINIGIVALILWLLFDIRTRVMRLESVRLVTHQSDQTHTEPSEPSTTPNKRESWIDKWLKR